MLQMKNMSFVMGIKLRIYPTNEQKSIIAANIVVQLSRQKFKHFIMNRYL